MPGTSGLVSASAYQASRSRLTCRAVPTRALLAASVNTRRGALSCTR